MRDTHDDAGYALAGLLIIALFGALILLSITGPGVGP